MRHFAIISALLLSALLSCGPRTGSQSTLPDARQLQDLPGNYTLKMIVDGESRYSTAIVKQLTDSDFQIARITVYGPVLYGFSLSREDAKVTSPELGKGFVTYQESIKKITIHFENEGGAVCELSR